jgi:membrane-associated protein
MEWLSQIAGLVLHLDQHLLDFSRAYGAWIYGLLFLIVFCETGLVITPFLPGDTLLFVAGTLAAAGALDPNLLAFLLVVAAIAGDSVNYAAGRWLGPRVFRMPDSWFFSRRYLEMAQGFYERHGGKTVVIARFVPIVRTYAPFVAGIGSMDYRRFLSFNVGGAILWVVLLVYGGYFFGNLPWVKDNLSKVIVGIIVLSVMPGVIEWWRNRRGAGR